MAKKAKKQEPKFLKPKIASISATAPSVFVIMLDRYLSVHPNHFPITAKSSSVGDLELGTAQRRLCINPSIPMGRRPQGKQGSRLQCERPSRSGRHLPTATGLGVGLMFRQLTSAALMLFVLASIGCAKPTLTRRYQSLVTPPKGDGGVTVSASAKDRPP